MGLFNRKEKVPEIPLAPLLPELPSISVSNSVKEQTLPELPSFPADSWRENINDNLAKHTFANNQTPEDNEVVVEPPQGGFHNIEGAIPSLPKPSLPFKSKFQQPNLSVQTEPIFIRIDKFQDAQKDFKQIKLKIKEIESALRKINFIKQREEAEISAWTQDLENLKARLAEIDANIFNKI